MSIRIAIVEDDEDMRKLTASLLNFHEGMECVGAFASAEDFVEALPTLRPDVVLMDIGLPGQSGIACVRACQEQYGGIDFIMFTDHTDSAEVFDAIKAGANGYVLKVGFHDRLAHDIRDIHAGGSPLNRQIGRMILNYLRLAEARSPDLDKLSISEMDILLLLDKGLVYKEIAARRETSVETVRTQIRSIYRKLQVHTRTEAINKLHGR